MILFWRRIVRVGGECRVTETSFCKCLPQQALVGSAVIDTIGHQDGFTRVNEGRCIRRKRQPIDYQLEALPLTLAKTVLLDEQCASPKRVAPYPPIAAPGFIAMSLNVSG